MKPKFYWHIHHDLLCEPLTEPLENRIRFIKNRKPKDELELRLKLLKPVRGKLPKAVLGAWVAYEKALTAYEKAGIALEKTLTMKSVLKLHKKECPDCPWDGETIFPEEEE